MRKLAFILIVLVVLIGCQKNSRYSISLMESGTPINEYFCPGEDCESALIAAIDTAEHSVHCAFFDIDLKELINKLNEKARQIDVKLVIDSDNYFNQTKGIPTILDDKNQLSHNKFCIIDKKMITTGSFNPTVNGNTKNSNNLMIINSKFLAENYEDEFVELWDSKFGEGSTIKYPKMIYNNILIENYFCPEDNCADRVIHEILNAKSSIYFMIFSFTDEDIADAILFSNVSDIKGVMDKMQAGGAYSQYKRLEEFGIDVKKCNNTKGMMHHKVFIIDNETVITGSYNPTAAGDNKNDENILIIHDKEIARRYLDEFSSLNS